MNKITRIVCLCILGAVGALCSVSTFYAPQTENKAEVNTPTEPLRSAYIVADITMLDPVAISLQDKIYVLERRTLGEYNGDDTLFTARADVLRLDENLQFQQPVTTYDIVAGEIAKFDNTPTAAYLAPISNSGGLTLLEFTRKPSRFRLVMQPKPAKTTNHFGITMPSKVYLATLRPCFNGGQPTTQSFASQEFTQQLGKEIFNELHKIILTAPDTPDSSKSSQKSEASKDYSGNK